MEIRAVKYHLLSDYVSLAKPRVVLPHLLTATSAMFLAARGTPNLSTMLFTLTGGGLVVCASNALNCYLDRDLDNMMPRTKNRPLPSMRLIPQNALIFAGVLGFIGIFMLVFLVNLTAAILAAVALTYYVSVYTLWLKRRTYLATIVGAGIGVFPPIIGWFAVTSEISLIPIMLGLIIALWTIPHFWALGIWRAKEYRSAGLNVLPDRAPVWINIFAVLTVAISILLIFVTGMGLVYRIAAIFLGVIFVLFPLLLLPGKTSINDARRAYFVSIIYLLVLFASIITEIAVS